MRGGELGRRKEEGAHLFSLFLLLFFSFCFLFIYFMFLCFPNCANLSSYFHYSFHIFSP